MLGSVCHLLHSQALVWCGLGLSFGDCNTPSTNKHFFWGHMMCALGLRLSVLSYIHSPSTVLLLLSSETFAHWDRIPRGKRLDSRMPSKTGCGCGGIPCPFAEMPRSRSHSSLAISQTSRLPLLHDHSTTSHVVKEKTGHVARTALRFPVVLCYFIFCIFTAIFTASRAQS